MRIGVESGNVIPGWCRSIAIRIVIQKSEGQRTVSSTQRTYFTLSRRRDGVLQLFVTARKGASRQLASEPGRQSQALCPLVRPAERLIITCLPPPPSLHPDGCPPSATVSLDWISHGERADEIRFNPIVSFDNAMWRLRHDEERCQVLVDHDTIFFRNALVSSFRYYELFNLTISRNQNAVAVRTYNNSHKNTRKRSICTHAAFFVVPNRTFRTFSSRLARGLIYQNESERSTICRVSLERFCSLCWIKQFSHSRSLFQR